MRRLVEWKGLAGFGIVLLSAVSLGGCVIQRIDMTPPPPYAVLPVDESMSCEAMTASFMFSARRAARLEYWLDVGPLPGYGFDRFGVDAPRELIAERQRLDALTDVQRTRGCPVLDPGPAVVFERQKLEEISRSRGAPLSVKG
ncbi:hypothetical protein [Tardiphaga robiniae]|uniref:Lipoprotein n=1 Tax=Tardiphaga robiniae TaxID=943830 RepID=A0A7G6TUM1_9BRAD|nr:hypothetical protein [Tardiphaga robiniae]QND70453.1 hypothetical protein HB776_03740 [Tardiphaga robiniae]